MSEQPKDGGPAFPTATPAIKKNYQPTGQVFSEEPIYSFTGMSLRDYFAAAAMKGFCANPDQEFARADFNKLSSWSYSAADAMLSERAKP